MFSVFSIYDIITVSLYGFFVYAIAIFALMKWKLRAFPGPFAVPILGNLWNPKAAAFMKYLIDNEKTYGKIFTFMPAMNAFLVIADPAVAREVLSNTKTFFKGVDYTKKVL